MKDKKFIQKAINPDNKGALRKKLGVKKDEKIPLNKLEKAKNSKNSITRKQANLALTLRKISNKNKD